MGNESGSATARLVFGLLIMCIGVLFLLGNMDILNPDDYFRLWPALLIIFGLVHILKPYQAPRFVFGIILMVVGTLMLLNNLYIFSFSFRDYWPVILIAVGIVMVLNHSIFSGRSRPSAAGGGDADAFLKVMSILSGFKRKCNSRIFKGGDLTAVMGGFEIDLRDADIDGEAVIEVFLLMGGGEIRVPDDWRVTTECLPILGGIEDKTYPRENADKRLIIRGTAIMGGMEIRN